MIRRLVRLVFRSQGSNQNSAWVLGSAALLIYDVLTSRTGRQELVDVSNIKPGETIIIQALDISHKDQIKQLKKERKAAEKEAKRQARAAKEQTKSAKATARSAKADARSSNAGSKKGRKAKPSLTSKPAEAVDGENKGKRRFRR